VCVPNKTLWTY
ncbi:histidine biosynthesis family protein, partial [Vibrio parahaemolyticus EKP-021]